MKKVNKSKNPSVQQMLNMASNLREKFYVPSTIEVVAWHYDSDSPNPNRMKYRLYVADRHSKDFDNWITLQGYYFTLMEEESS